MSSKGVANVVVILLTAFVVAVGLYFVLVRPSAAPTTVALPPSGRPAPKISITYPSAAGALIRECADPAYVKNSADSILQAMVEKVSSEAMANGAIETNNDFTILNYSKGAPFSEARLRIVTLGGISGDQNLRVEDQPIFTVGEKVRLYLVQRDDQFTFVCGEYGVEKL